MTPPKRYEEPTPEEAASQLKQLDARIVELDDAQLRWSVRALVTAICTGAVCGALLLVNQLRPSPTLPFLVVVCLGVGCIVMIICALVGIVFTTRKGVVEYRQGRVLKVLRSSAAQRHQDDE
jgi:hypothetical protein